jgi:hypothetical protein
MENSCLAPIMESKNINRAMDRYLQEMLDLYHGDNPPGITGYNDKKSKDASYIHLQRRLALRTYYLKEFVLTPLMNRLIYPGSKGEPVRLYRAYCYFFDRELSSEEFSGFLSHVIIDGFLRAGIFPNEIKGDI